MPGAGSYVCYYWRRGKGSGDVGMEEISDVSVVIVFGY